MRRRFLLFLVQILALSQMGGECYFSTGTNNQIPPDHPEEGEGEGEDKGLLIVIREGDVRQSPEPTPQTARSFDRDTAIDPALNILIDPPTEAQPSPGIAAAAHSADLAGHAPLATSMPGEHTRARATTPPIPEPRGWILFVAGFTAVEWFRRRSPRGAQ